MKDNFVNNSKMYVKLLFVTDVAANTMEVAGTLSRLIIYDTKTHPDRRQHLRYSVWIFHTKLRPQSR